MINTLAALAWSLLTVNAQTGEHTVIRGIYLTGTVREAWRKHIGPRCVVYLHEPPGAIVGPARRGGRGARVNLPAC